MPTYEYTCDNGHITESRAGYGDNSPLPCPTCGLRATRQSVYLIIPFTETGVKVGRMADTPLDERRVKVSKFQEAAAEIDHAAKKIEEVTGKPLNLNHWQKGVDRARAIAAGKAPPPKEKF